MAEYGGYIRDIGFERGQLGHDAHLPIGDYEGSRLHVASGRPRLQAFPELIFYFLAGFLGRKLNYRWQDLSGCVICVYGTGLCDGFLFPQLGEHWWDSGKPSAWWISSRGLGTANFLMSSSSADGGRRSSSNSRIRILGRWHRCDCRTILDLYIIISCWGV